MAASAGVPALGGRVEHRGVLVRGGERASVPPPGPGSGWHSIVVLLHALAQPFLRLDSLTAWRFYEPGHPSSSGGGM
jgi:hypothetical protein